MTRGEILRHVAYLIENDRARTHGSAVEQLAHAQRLKILVGHRNNSVLSLTELEAIDMICVKLSRLAHGSPIRDHWDDIAGYAAIGGEARDAQLRSIKIRRKK